MRCRIAETFHKFPHEVAQLPLREYQLCRNYVLAKIEVDKEASEEMSWGDKDLAEAPWETEVVTTQR